MNETTFSCSITVYMTKYVHSTSIATTQLYSSKNCASLSVLISSVHNALLTLATMSDSFLCMFVYFTFDRFVCVLVTQQTGIEPESVTTGKLRYTLTLYNPAKTARFVQLCNG
jgi:hypothetical protein